LFTIIIATHNRPELLQRTLLSLAAQTYQNFTTIIISDSASYVAPYHGLKALPENYLYLLRNSSPGPALSRNLGIKLVETDYAIFLDDDDTLEANHLELLASSIEKYKNNSKTIYYCDFKIIEEDRTSSPPKRLKETPINISNIQRESVFVKNIIPNSCLLYPKKVLQSNQFDPTLILFEDWDYLLSCLKQTRLHYLPINSVCIHKSYVAGKDNIRRGNVNDEHLISTTLEIFKRHHTPNEMVRRERIEHFKNIGIQLQPEHY